MAYVRHPCCLLFGNLQGHDLWCGEDLARDESKIKDPLTSDACDVGGGWTNLTI